MSPVGALRRPCASQTRRTCTCRNPRRGFICPPTGLTIQQRSVFTKSVYTQFTCLRLFTFVYIRLSCRSFLQTPCVYKLFVFVFVYEARRPWSAQALRRRSSRTHEAPLRVPPIKKSIFRRFPAALEDCAAAGAGVPTFKGLVSEPLPGTS